MQHPIVNRIVGTLGGIFRLRPYDRSDEAGRSKERYRRIALASSASVLSKCISILTTLVSVPLTLNYLGAERYGLWMTASSIIIVLGFSDLGMGYGLLNSIAEAYGKEDRNAAKESVSSAFYVLTAISVLIMAFFFILYPLVPWQTVFNVQSIQAAGEAGPALLVLMMLFAANIPVAVVQRVQMGYQEGYINDLYQVCGNLLALCGILISTNLELGLPWLILSFVGAPLAVTWINYLVQFRVRMPWLRPRFDLVNLTLVRKILSNGGMILFLTVLTMIGFQTDILFISHFQGASAVTSYSIVQKLSSIAILYWAFINALWPAYGEAFARYDYDWIRRTILRSLNFSLSGGLIIGAGLFFFGNMLIRLWLGDAVQVDGTLLLGFAAFIFVNGLIGVIAVVYNSSFLIERQAIPFLIATAVSLLLKYLLGRYAGANYIVWSTTVSYGFLYLIPCSLMLRRAYFSPQKASTEARG